MAKKRDPDQSITSVNCKGSGATTEFIGCEGEGDRPSHWVNVRFVQDITPLPQR